MPTGGMTASRELPRSVLSGTIVSPRTRSQSMICGKGRDRLRTIAAGVVQEDDAAVVALLFDSLQNHIRAGSRPILGIDVLEDDEVIHFVRNPERREIGERRRAGIGGVGRTEQSGRATGDRLEKQAGSRSIRAGRVPASKSRGSDGNRCGSRSRAPRPRFA